MSDNENVPQEQDSEEQPLNDGSASADPSDLGGSEGDPPIIIQGGGSGTPG